MPWGLPATATSSRLITYFIAHLIVLTQFGVSPLGISAAAQAFDLSLGTKILQSATYHVDADARVLPLKLGDAQIPSCSASSPCVQTSR